MCVCISRVDWMSRDRAPQNKSLYFMAFFHEKLTENRGHVAQFKY